MVVVRVFGISQKQGLISHGEAALDIADEGEGTREEVGAGEAPPLIQQRIQRGECLLRALLKQTAGGRARGEQSGDVGASGERGLQQPEVVVPKSMLSGEAGGEEGEGVVVILLRQRRHVAGGAAGGFEMKWWLAARLAGDGWNLPRPP